MNKILLLTILLLTSLLINAQTSEIDSLCKVEDNKVVFTKIIEDINGNRDEIYQRALIYFANAYKSANDVIQMKDKDAGTIIGKGIFTVYESSGLSSETVKCDHTLRIDAKDNRARIVLSVQQYDIHISAISAQSLPTNYKWEITEVYPFTKKRKRGFSKIYEGLCNTVNTVFSDIEKSLKAESSIVNDTDW